MTEEIIKQEEARPVKKLVQVLRQKTTQTGFKYAIVVRKLEEAFSIGCTVTEACVYGEISRDTYYRWIKNNKTLSDRFEALKEKPILTARNTVVQALPIDVNTAKWYLERKRKDEFTAKEEIEHSTEDNGLNIVITSKNDENESGGASQVHP